MDRINGADTVDIGGGRRGFRSEDLGNGLIGTEVTSLFMNMIQEEIMMVVEEAGLVADPGDWTQLWQALLICGLSVGGSARRWTTLLSMTTTAPPASPAKGATYLVPAGATGAWAANVGKIAEWTGSVWSYITPPDGHVFGLSNSSIYQRRAGAYVELVATETIKGLVELATAAEVSAGTDTARVAAVARIAAAIQTGTWNFAVAAGSVNARTATLAPAPAALVAGLCVSLSIPAPNTAAATLNLNGLGVKSILPADGSALAPGDLSGFVHLVYDGAAFRLVNVNVASETQRGIVELATTAETEDGTDLTRVPAVGRLVPAVQAGGWNYAITGGIANAQTAAISPAPAALTAGLRLVLKITTPNTGAASLNLNGLGAKSILCADNAALVAGDLSGTVHLVYDGTNFLLLNFFRATETQRGMAELATAAETAAGTDPARVAPVSRMAAAVQAGGWSYAVAAGAVNARTATLTPAPAALAAGLCVMLSIPAANTAAATLNLNGLGVKSILLADGSDLAPGDLSGFVHLVYDGTVFRLVNFFVSTEAARGYVELATAAETASGTDLTRVPAVGRLVPAVQAGGWNYAVAGGTAAAQTAAISPAPAALTAGLRLVLKITTPNTGAATLNLNGLGAKSILCADGAALSAGDVSGLVLLVYDGASWLLANVYGATETQRGIVELGTLAEVKAGTDLARSAAIGRIAAIVQGGSWNYAVAGGTANALTAALTPAPASLAAITGSVIWIKTGANANTAAVTLNLNALGAKSIKSLTGAALAAGRLPPASIVPVVYDGADFRLLCDYLPAGSGILQSDAGILSWISPGAVVKPAAILADQKAAGATGGALVSSTWTVRALNTDLLPPSGLYTLASNEFTVNEDCLCRYTAPAYAVGRYRHRIYNVTDGVVVDLSTSGYTGNNSSVDTQTTTSGICSLAAGKKYRLETWVQSGGANSGGLNNLDGGLNLFSQIELYRL